MPVKDYSIVNIGLENIDEAGVFCLTDKNHPGYSAKMDWIHKRLEEGLRYKLARTDEGEQIGFLEYIPGEYSWRVVHAPNYLVIHCLWVQDKNDHFEGLASALLEECVLDAQLSGKTGVAVVTSDGPWMISKDLFLKHNFEQVDQADPYYQLLIKKVNKGPLPYFPTNWEERLNLNQDMRLIYTSQCPFIGKTVAELPRIAHRYGIEMQLVELKTPKEARNRMPSPYGTISLMYKGQLLADHPVSVSRFKDILRNDLHLKRVN